MKIIDRKYVEENKGEIITAILDGKIFIYPTDTIYGIGCNALKNECVNKIREIKKRKAKPFSVIAPNLEWIKENCEISDEAEKNLSNLPGPYTLFLNLKNKNCVSKSINPINDNTLGIRIPDHWFSEIIKKADVPFVTTSVNTSGAPFMTSLENIEENIKNSVDCIIYDGEINSAPSIKIDLRKNQ